MPPLKGRVIVVGSSNTDLVVHCPALPLPGETVLGGDLLTFAGGKGANQAVAAARGGARVHFIGAFGSDDFGGSRKYDLEKEGIDCSGCAYKKKSPSGVALIAIGRGGQKSSKAENQILVAPGANAKLTTADVRRGMPKNLTPQDVVLGSLEVPLPAIKEAFQLAHRKGAVTLLNPAPFPPSGLPTSLLKLCRIFTPNELEFKTLLGSQARRSIPKSRLEAVLRSLADSPEHPAYCLITQGSKGATCHHLGSSDATSATNPVGKRRSGRRLYTKHVAAPRVRAIDTVGAGDCFSGCLAAAIARNPNGLQDLEQAIRYAISGAALNVTRAGAQAGMPTRAEILRHMAAIKA